MGLGYSGVVTQARAQKADLVNEQRQTRLEERQDKRQVNTELAKLNAQLTNKKNKLETAKNKRTTATLNDQRNTYSNSGSKIGQAVGSFGGFGGAIIGSMFGKGAGEVIEKISVSLLDRQIKTYENEVCEIEAKIKSKQDALAERSTDRQTLLDDIQQEITACDEQIKDSKKQGEEATKEMFGANG